MDNIYLINIKPAQPNSALLFFPCTYPLTSTLCTLYHNIKPRSSSNQARIPLLFATISSTHHTQKDTMGLQYIRYSTLLHSIPLSALWEIPDLLHILTIMNVLLSMAFVLLKSLHSTRHMDTHPHSFQPFNQIYWRREREDGWCTPRSLCLLLITAATLTFFSRQPPPLSEKYLAPL